MVALIDVFLDWCQKHRSPDTYAWYRDPLQKFASKYPDLSPAELRPFHVQVPILGVTYPIRDQNRVTLGLPLMGSQCDTERKRAGRRVT